MGRLVGRPANKEGESPPSVVRSLRLVHAPRLVPHHRRQGGAVATQTQPLGCHASHDHRASHWRAKERDPRLLRGWAEPDHHGDERLGRRRTFVVAQSPDESSRHSRPGQRPTPGPGTGRRRRGTVAAVGPLAGNRRRLGCIRSAPVQRDRSRGTRTMAGVLTRQRASAQPDGELSFSRSRRSPDGCQGQRGWCRRGGPAIVSRQDG